MNEKKVIRLIKLFIKSRLVDLIVLVNIILIKDSGLFSIHHDL